MKHSISLSKCQIIVVTFFYGFSNLFFPSVLSNFNYFSLQYVLVPDKEVVIINVFLNISVYY